MNMKLNGWMRGRQRSEMEYTPQIARLPRMMRSPTLNERCVSTPGSSLVMIASTPRSEIAMPTVCPGVRRAPTITTPAAAMNSGASEFITETLSAVVSCRPTNCSAPNNAPPSSDR